MELCIDIHELGIVEAQATKRIGQIVHVWYDLHIIIKHNAWNEVGMGKIVPFPISIVPKPQVSRLSNDAFEHDNWTP